jgi:two-component system NtrC family sensor kinase
MPVASQLRKSGFRTYGVLSLAITISLAIFGAFSWRHYETLVSDAKMETSRYSLLLAEQATRTFEAVDFTLRGIEPLLERDIAPHDLTVQALLRRRASELGFIQNIRVLDPQGNEVQQSNSFGSGTNGAKLNFFIELAQALPQSVVIGPTEESIGHEHPGIPVARRLSKPDGSFDGVIVADVDPNHFALFFRALDLGPGAVVRLTQDGGRLILASTLGTSVTPAGPVITKQHGFESLERSPEQTISAVHQTEGYPLAVTVSVDRDELRSKWLDIVIPSFFVLALIDALFAGIVMVIARSRSERAKAQQRAIVAQKLEAIGQTTASIAHDFRNILAVITATLRLLRRRGPDEALLREAEATLERGNAMIEQLLAFSRRQDLRVTAADINALLRQIGGVLRHIAGPDITLAFKLQDPIPLCKLDHTQFDAALMNLVSNAREAMLSGGRVEFETRVAHAKEADTPASVILEVSDNGCGIDEASSRRVFEPFFTTKQTGTGLGLAQVYGFMQQIGGDVTIRSAPGAGTSISLYFPVISPDCYDIDVAASSTLVPKVARLA